MNTTARIKGISVVLYEKAQTGTDDFNRPIYEETAVTVENVLVAPGTATPGSSVSREIANETNLSGKEDHYVLAIPKGDAHKWEDCDVEFFGGKFHVISVPMQGIDDMIPLDWNKKVKVERYVQEGNSE